LLSARVGVEAQPGRHVRHVESARQLRGRTVRLTRVPTMAAGLTDGATRPPSPDRPAYPRARFRIYAHIVLELTALDLDEVATALSDQSGYEHCWLIHMTTGELVFWTRDTGIDGHHPVDLDDLDPDLLGIDPLPSH